MIYKKYDDDLLDRYPELENPTIPDVIEGIQLQEEYRKYSKNSIKVPVAMLKNSSLSKETLTTYMLIDHYCKGSNFCVVTYKQLGQDLGCTGRAVQRAISKCKEAGLLAVGRISRDGSNIYVLKPLPSDFNNEPVQSQGCVYVLRSALNPTLCKIGKTTNLKNRLSQYKTSVPDLELLKVIETDDELALEKNLHDKYGSYRKSGEWFDLPLDEIEKMIS